MGLLHLGITEKERSYRVKNGNFALIFLLFHISEVEILRISSFLLFFYRRFLARSIVYSSRSSSDDFCSKSS